MLETSEYLEALTKGSQRSEEEVLANALKTGLRQLWREQVLDQYLHGKLARTKAVEAVGADLVELADRQRQAMQEDVQWGQQPQSKQ